MRRISARPPQRQRSTQRGQILFVILVILVIGFGAAFYAFVGPTGSAIERDKITTAALAQAKEALIGWSAARTPSTSALIPPGLNARPGELPCPDTDNSGTDAGACVAGAIGRVPWKSLGIPEPKDSTGETLWYAIAGPFRNSNMSSAPITSDTLGNLTVYLDSSATTLTSQGVAVIFAPGASLGAQDRSCTVGVNCTATRQCTTSPASLTPICNPTNYLEATGGGNNAQTGGPYIQAQSSGTFNDRLLAITNADLMPVVEQRVAREMRSLLEAYRVATLVYPWADISSGSSDLGYNRGRFPCNVALPFIWGNVTPSTPTLPLWLTNGCGSNGWASVIYYAAAKNRLAVGCTTCDATPPCPIDLSLSVNGVCGTSLVLLTPGAYTGNPARIWPNIGGSAITGYFEDAENSDNNNDRYVTPSASVYNRDRIFTIP